MWACPDPVDTAVIVNEFGAVGIDHLLLEAADQEILKLPNGCACYVARQDSGRHTVPSVPPSDLLSFQRLALETSGLATKPLSADALLEQALQVHAVVRHIVRSRVVPPLA